METRQLRKRVRGMLAESPPEWLPDGWTVEVRNTRHGKYRYYRSSVSGCTFQSKEEVLHHLSVVKHDDGTSGRASCSNESKMQLSEEMKQFHEWLPSGWVLEIKSQRSGKNTGKTYKCYFEPLSGDRFYSKREVLSFLSSGKVHERTSEKRKHLNRNPSDNVIAHIEFSPDGLPHGWIKETKFKEGNGGLSKNPYYTDPIYGYVFNSLKDAIHYVETGFVSKHAYKPKRSAKEACSFNDDSPSPDCAKKRKSQPTGKKHHLTEEILVSNGELSETATVPDGLLQPPSSQENVEVKPDEENAPESATFSSPCPVNSREITPKSGRIPTAKCTRKSDTSNEKANMESEENIKQEKVTEKPSGPSDQTVMDIQSDGKELTNHAEDEANQGGESTPGSAPNSKENSKQEDEATLQVKNITDEFLVVSNETSKDLLGDEMKLPMTNQKTSAERGNFLDPQKKNLSELEKELAVLMGNPSTPDLVKPKHGSRKNKSLNAIPRPQRLSRRLACADADSVIDMDMGGERPRELQSNDTTIDLLKEPPRMKNNDEDMAASTTESLERNNTMEESLERNNTMEDGAAVMNQATMDWPDLSSTSPFGDFWLDPCLEFAFKTLTSDLPVLDDTITIQDYFQQQIFSVVESTSPDVLAPASNNKTDTAAASDEVGIQLPSEQDMEKNK